MNKKDCGINILMPSISSIFININNGETLMYIENQQLRFKGKNSIIEQNLTAEQASFIIDSIANKIRIKCDEISEGIFASYKEMIK